MANDGSIPHQPFNIDLGELGNFIDLKILEASSEVIALIQNRAP
jgi:hypothetical protein